LIDIALNFNFNNFDVSLHSLIRISNTLEHFFDDFRKKANKIGDFPHKDSYLSAFFLIVQSDHVKHDRLKKPGE